MATGIQWTGNGSNGLLSTFFGTSGSSNSNSSGTTNGTVSNTTNVTGAQNTSGWQNTECPNKPLLEVP